MFKKLLLFSFFLLLTAGHTQCDEQQKQLEEQLKTVQTSKKFVKEVINLYRKNIESSANKDSLFFITRYRRNSLILRDFLLADKYLHKLDKKEQKIRKELANLQK